MSLVFRHHLSHSQAHILAGVLAANDVPALVVGDLAANLYGGIPALDCSVMVPEELLEDAENLMRSDFAGEPPDDSLPPEQCPSDGDPPGVGVMLCASLLLGAAGLAVHTFILILSILATHTSPEGYLHMALRTLVFVELPALVVGMLIHAVATGLLLRIIRGYRRGSLISRAVVKALLVLLIL